MWCDLVAMMTAFELRHMGPKSGPDQGIPMQATRPSRVQALRRGYCHNPAQTPCPTHPRPSSEPPSPSSCDWNVPVGFRLSSEPPIHVHPAFTPTGSSAGLWMV